MSGILIGADCVPTKCNIDAFCKAESKKIIGEELHTLFDNADYRILNLEAPLTNVLYPIKKKGPALSVPEEAINGFKAMGIDLFTLANNHIFDQGPVGLNHTINNLKKNNIAYVGAGENIHEAAKPHIFAFGQKTIGIYACAEHEFSIATETDPGANAYDPLDTPDHIESLKEKCDYVIVLYHGGKELYQYPSPQLQKRCRKMVEKGADLVICQHSHCIGCKEQYLSGTIVYGQGNFLFNKTSNELWKTGLVIKIDNKLDLSFIPIVESLEGVKLADKHEGTKILEAFNERSNKIINPDYIESEYLKFAENTIDKYLSIFLGKKGIIFRFINHMTKGELLKIQIKKKYDIKELLAIQNYIECEAHRELLLRGIKNGIGNDKKEN